MEQIVAGTILLLTIVSPITQAEIKSTNGLVFSSPQKVFNQIQTNKIPNPTANSTPITTPTIPVSKFKIYTVNSGDTFDSIAKNSYGSGKYWKMLWNDNPDIENPALIKKGMVLNIRNDRQEEAEDLSIELTEKFAELNATPTPTPTLTASTTISSGNPSSFDDAYHQAGSKFGVPWEILYGLHHMETGGRDGNITSGYGTGAQGPLQFMPGTWAAYGIDGNGDGNPDINNAIDAIFGAANYIATHGGVESGLKAYGGNSELVLNYARSRGYSQ